MGSRGGNVSEIQALKSDIERQKINIGRWDNATIVFVTLAFVAAGGLVITSIALKRKHESLEISQDRLAALIEDLRETDSKATDLRIADAGRKASEAEAKAEGFRLSIATANRQAEEAKERAVQAELQLAKFKTPRTLSLEQQKRISEKLKGFAGTQFDVALLMDPECQNLLPQIENALKAAGWVEIDWKGGDIAFTRPNLPVTGIATVTGVIIQMHPEQVEELRQAALTLDIALNVEGIASEAQGGVGIANTNSKAIHILIGKKPQ